MPARPRGRFITLEGGEGAGKSTQAQLLAGRLRSAGRSVCVTREPGGSSGAEAIRALLVTGAAGRWSPLSETLLFYAARADHLDHTIRPALKRGDWVVCDRFFDSTRAYQGHADGVDFALLDALDARVIGSARPDLTLILDLPVAEGLARAASRRPNGEARFETKEKAFHEAVRQGFLAIAKTEPDRCRLIDARPGADDVAQAIWQATAMAFHLDSSTDKAVS